MERFRDQLGDWRICILAPFGSRVHAPWARAIQNILSSRAGFEVETMYTDDGIVLRFADVEELPPLDLLIPDPEDVEDASSRSWQARPSSPRASARTRPARFSCRGAEPSEERLSGSKD